MPSTELDAPLCAGALATLLGAAPSLPTALPAVGEVSAAVLPPVTPSGLLGVADAFREPASMAPFADEGSGAGVASSFGVRQLVRRPGGVAAPLLGGSPVTDVGTAWVFYVGGAAALVGAGAFLAALVLLNGAGVLTER